MASSGFGWTRFGAGPWGEADWSRNVFWDSVPGIYRDSDTDGDLETFLVDGVGASFDLTRRQLREFPDLRDPLKVRTRYNDIVTVTITGSDLTEADDTDDGVAYITFYVNPVEPLRTVAPGWLMESVGRNYVVRSIEKISGAFTVYGDTIPVGASFEIRPPSTIEYLGKDFGVEIDGHEPESFQRAIVANAVQWFNIKGTERGIVARGKLAGFAVEVWPLYGIDAVLAAMLPIGTVFLSGSDWYTTLSPQMVLYDEMAADVIPADAYCFASTFSWPVVVATSGGVSGAWALTTPSDLGMVGTFGCGHWKLVQGDLEFYIEDGVPALGTMSVAGSLQPLAGGYNLVYECPEVNSCSWCLSYKIMVQVTPENPELLASVVAMEGAYERLIAKVQAILPAHVEILEFVFVTSGEVTVEIAGSGLAMTYTFGLFDDVEADVMPADEYTVTYY